MNFAPPKSESAASPKPSKGGSSDKTCVFFKFPFASTFWPFLRRSAVSIVLINELGAVPINAGRNSGSVEPGDGEGDRDFGVWDETKPAPTSEATNKRIPTRMGT